MNYDQTWILAFRSPKKFLRKTNKARGKHDVNRMSAIINGRHGLTMCTSTWASGQVGPLLVSIGSNASGITSKWVDSMNEKGKGCFFIIQNDHRSHFMTAATTLSMYENLYGPAFDMRRELLGLQGRPGFLMSDAFTGNAALHSGIGLLREKFASLYNIRLPQQQPGGWSAHGQPQAGHLLSNSFTCILWVHHLLCHLCLEVVSCI